jgi:RNA polymerase sigma-70 factor, ECF subfamily
VRVVETRSPSKPAGRARSSRRGTFPPLERLTLERRRSCHWPRHVTEPPMPRVPGGDSSRDAFASEALPHLDQIHGAAMFLCRDAQAAADLVQETYLRAFRFFHQFEPGTNCRAWLLTILHNTFRNLYRAQRRARSEVDVDDPVTALEVATAGGVDNDPQTLVLAEMVDQEIVEALAELPEDFRSAIVLIDLQGLTYEEGARVLDCPIGTVRSRLSRARRQLEGKLAGYARGRGLRRKGSV